MRKPFRYTGILLILGLLLVFCEKEPIDDNSNKITEESPSGELIVDFKIPIVFRQYGDTAIRRASLELAENAELLYKKRFFKTFNVYDSQEIYKVSLAPGTYYYSAGLLCCMGNNMCSGLGFPGGQDGMVYTVDRFIIEENKTTKVTPAFH